MPERTRLRRAGGSLQRHERTAIVVYLSLVSALVLVLGVWGVGLGGAERVVRAWNQRWVERVERAEALLESGELETAAAALERLDRDFPARTVEHALDRERERLMGALGRCYLGLDRKRDALATFARRVEFDPLNYRNHLELAEAARATGELATAGEAWRAVLAIHPSHYPSLRALIESAHDGGRYVDVPLLYEGYLDGYLLAPVVVRLGAAEALIEVPVDGRPHELDLPFEVLEELEGELCLATGGFSASVERVELVPPVRVGVPSARAPRVLADEVTWRASGMQASPGGGFAATSPTSELCADAPPPEGGAARLGLRLTLFKHVDAELWQQVERSYVNALDREGLERARARTRVGGHPEAGSVFVD